jgi:hypothetical protein
MYFLEDSWTIWAVARLCYRVRSSNNDGYKSEDQRYKVHYV